MSADLHIHTTASDGRLSPEQIYDSALTVGLRTIAITDHDTTAGVIRLNEILSSTASPTKLQVINGIEMSCDYPDHEVHILGYHIDAYNPQLTEHLRYILEDRVTRAEKIVKKLNQLGYTISVARVKEVAGTARSIGRPHIAQALVKQGYFTTLDEIFDGLLHKGGPAYVPHYKLTPANAVELIRHAGGVAVLAHPGLVGNNELVEQLLTSLPIQGLEVFHPTHSPTQTQTYLEVAERRGLTVTGGSDFHGIPDRFPESLGIFTIDDACADNLISLV